jgi:MoaA/NifB/PqqE/SkfB family radical SAM enzyme
MNGDSPERTGVLDVDRFCARVEEYVRSAGRSDAITEIRITGGEPLLYPKEIVKIASFCKTHGIGCGINTAGWRRGYENLSGYARPGGPASPQRTRRIGGKDAAGN